MEWIIYFNWKQITNLYSHNKGNYMITLSDIKREHQDVIQIIYNLSSQLATEKLHNETRSKLIGDLAYWNTIQHYLLKKYKNIESAPDET